MNTKKINELLGQLRNELSQSLGDLNEESKQQITDFDRQIGHLMNNKNLQQQDLYKGIMQLEYSFLNEHPMAANLMRGIVDMLSKTGI